MTNTLDVPKVAGSTSLHPDAAALLHRAVNSLKLAIELFNRPYDDGRPETVLILLHHAFEMILKSMIVEEAGQPCFNEKGYSHSFDQCLQIAYERLQVIDKDQRRFLSMLDNLRDAATHYYQVITEDVLYIFAQGAVTLFDFLHERACGTQLSELLPARILPLSSRPPRDLHLLMDDEFKAMRDALREMRMTKEEAIAAIRPLMALSVGSDEEARRVTLDELETATAALQEAEDWRVVFPEIAKLRVSFDGTGVQIGVRIVKDDPAAMPMRLWKLGDEGQPEGTIIVREVNPWDTFNLGLYQLAEKLGITAPKTLALIREFKVQEDSSMFRELVIGASEHKRYSKKVLEFLRGKVPEAESVWKKHRDSLTRPKTRGGTVNE